MDAIGVSSNSPEAVVATHTDPAEGDTGSFVRGHLGNRLEQRVSGHLTPPLANKERIKYLAQVCVINKK